MTTISLLLNMLGAIGLLIGLYYYSPIYQKQLDIVFEGPKYEMAKQTI